MLFGTMTTQDNQLTIGGRTARDLIADHGSPLYVYDLALIKHNLRAFKTHFSSKLFDTRIAYASKAFLTKAMVRLLQAEGTSLDLVSAGELHTAIAGGFDLSQALFHGNNKSPEELELCLSHGVGLIMVDNIDELDQLIERAAASGQVVHTLLRVNPGVEAHTHEYVITAKHSSKFGESIYDNERIAAIMNRYRDQSHVVLDGFHCHIGSQIFDITSYLKTIEVMSTFINKITAQFELSISTLNLGGGFGVFYTDGDTPMDIETTGRTLIRALEEKQITNELSIKTLIIEPGRSIVANAGTTLYTVGHTKRTYGGRHYLFVDGGMTDNIRPALYQAEYSADLANRMTERKDTHYTVAGKLCESGDVLIRDIQLPAANPGDILAIYSTGAYTYSMASNYNRLLRPAVVFVEDGKSSVVVRRETYDDLLRNDV